MVQRHRQHHPQCARDIASLPLAFGQPHSALERDRWSGLGIAHYDVYVSVDGGALSLWKGDTTATSGQYPVAIGHTYGFAARAVSVVGIQGPVPTSPQASTSVTPTVIHVTTVRGTQVSGSSTPTFSGTFTKPGGATVSGDISCAKVTTATAAIDAALAVGTYTIKASTCTGLVANTGDYTFSYSAKATGFTVTKPVIPAPSVTSLTPTSGSTTGDTKVTIKGSHLTGTSKVQFGTSTATGVKVTSPTKVTATAPAHAAGSVAVTVVTTHGTGTKASAFTFVVPAPTISSLTPTSGSTTGGTKVTIKGSHLTGTSKVQFGTSTATGVKVTSPTKVTATAPAHAAGSVAVTVVTTHGTGTKASAFTFVVPAPTISSLTPTSGSTTGGTKVTIKGSHLTGTSKVQFGTSTATGVKVTSPTKVTATAPAHAAGSVAVTVVTTHGTGTKASAFTFVVPAPTISSLTPTSGSTTGGTKVTIDGSHLTGTTSVLFGTTAATQYTEVSASQLTVTSPPHGAAAVTVAVTTTHGKGQKATAFTFVTPPPPPPPPPPAKTAGYDMVGSDGGVFVFSPPGTTGGFFGSLPGLTPPVRVNNIVGMVPTASDQGYFLVGSDGGVFAFGNAPFLGSLPGLRVTPTQPITGLVPTGTDGGYFLVGKDGGVFAFGNATFAGSLPGIGVHRTDIIGIAATPSGSGYWLVAADGTVYGFGASQTLGSATGTSSPVTAIAGTPDGGGYWIVTANGSVHAFGDAQSYGTLPALGVSPALPVIGIVHTADTHGYWLIGKDGGIFALATPGSWGPCPAWASTSATWWGRCRLRVELGRRSGDGGRGTGECAQLGGTELRRR